MALSLHNPSKIFRTKYDGTGDFMCLNCLQTISFEGTNRSIEDAGENHVCGPRVTLKGQTC